MKDTIIGSGPTQSAPQSPRHGRLRPAGIRRRVLTGVFHHYQQARPAGEHQQRARNSRWHEIGDIVSTSSRPTECTPALFFVSDEAIGRIESLVGKQSRETETQEKPEGRRDDAIIEALGETLQRCSG